MSRGGRRREARAEIRRNMDLLPLPRHPYRDSAVFYGVLSVLLVVVVYLTGGSLARAFVVAGGFFVIATGFSWWRFREKLARHEGEQ